MNVRSLRKHGKAAPIPPPSKKQKKELRVLTCFDSAHGAPKCGTDREKQWHRDEQMMTTPSAAVSSASSGASGSSAASSSESDYFASTRAASELVARKPGSVCTVGAAEENNTTVPFQQLKHLFERSARCSACRSPLVLIQESFGFATNLQAACKGCNESKKIHQSNLTADLVAAAPPRKQHDGANKHMANAVAAMMMWQLGIGLDGLATVFGFLGMRSDCGDYTTWKTLQDETGEAVEQVCREVLIENQWKEVKATTEAAMKSEEPLCIGDGRVGVGASCDEGWQGKGSCNACNSPSGHDGGHGVLTKLPLAFQVFSKLCNTCSTEERLQELKAAEREAKRRARVAATEARAAGRAAAAAAAEAAGTNNDNSDDDGSVNMSDESSGEEEEESSDEEEEEEQEDGVDDTNAMPEMHKCMLRPATDHRCPKNWDGSSKAMEATATVCMMTTLWRQGICHCRALATDDDSTTRSACSADLSMLKKMLPADVPREECWPQVEVKKGKRKGQLRWATDKGREFRAMPGIRNPGGQILKFVFVSFHFVFVSFRFFVFVSFPTKKKQMKKKRKRKKPAVQKISQLPERNDNNDTRDTSLESCPFWQPPDIWGERRSASLGVPPAPQHRGHPELKESVVCRG